MNFAQLIDPEYVEALMREARGSKAAAPRVVVHVTHDDDEDESADDTQPPAKDGKDHFAEALPLALAEASPPRTASQARKQAPPDRAPRPRARTLQAKILCLLAEHGTLASGEIAAKTGAGINTACSILRTLKEDRCVTRSGFRRDYTYAINAAGRLRLADIEAAMDRT